MSKRSASPTTENGATVIPPEDVPAITASIRAAQEAREAKQAKTIEIPEIKLARMIVHIEGQTALITHRFGERALGQIESKQQKVAKLAREARDPKAEFMDALYVIDEESNVYGFPASGIKKALVYAGGRFADEKMTELRGVINIEGDLLPIEGSRPVMRRDAVKIDGGRTSSIAYRPMFLPWRISVPVVYISTMISEAQVLNLFNIAGFTIGIGDWRPERNGTFGQFSVAGAEAQ